MTRTITRSALACFGLSFGFTFGLALALLLAPLPAKAQESDSPESSRQMPGNDTFIDTIDVNVVNVDIYVTDKKGNRITGLSADDFEVFENGRPMTITNFYAVEDRRPVDDAPAADEDAEAEVPGQPTTVEVPKLPEDQRLYLVVYIDNLNIHPFTRNRVMREVRAFLANELTREDRVMLVTYERTLHVRHNFTSDAKLVARELFEIEEHAGMAVHRDSERRDVMERINDSETIGEAMSWARSYAESVQNDLLFTVDAMRDIVGSLAGIPGRKAILYVSDGIPMIAGEEVFYAIDQKFVGSGSLTTSREFDSSRRFQELTSHANANRVSFYTIDAEGLRTMSSLSAEVAGDGAGSQIFIDQIFNQNLQGSLQLIAEETGGVAVINQNRVGPALERIAGDFKTFYSLGYTPSHSGDGRYYRIEVKLKEKRRDWVLRHRTGYRDKTAHSRMTDGTLAALHFPFSQNDMNLQLAVGRMAQRPDGYYDVQIEVRVPLDEVLLVPQGEYHEARLKVYVAALDDEGGISPVSENPLPISIPNADIEGAQGKFYSYTLNLLMRRGSQKVAIGVRDDLASESSYVSRRLIVGS